MLIKNPEPIAPSEITPKSQWLGRREIIKGAAASTGQIPNRVRSPLSTDELPTSLADISSDNNMTPSRCPASGGP